MTRKHIVFIVNPKSGVDRKGQVRNAIQDHLNHELFSHEVLDTRYVKHGTLLAKQAAEKGAFAVVAVGGDGSINDVVRGLQGTSTILAIIPKGSGNGLARTMNIPLNTAEAIEVINKQQVANIDVAYADNELFLSNAGVAFDALISKKFAKSVNRGFLNYSWLVTKYLWMYKNWKFDVTLDGAHMKEEAFIVNVANGQQFGYNMKIASTASYTDGLLDVVIIKKFPKILGGLLALRMARGTLHKSRFVEQFRAKEITLSNPELRLMQTDGDAHACDKKVKFVIKPASQKVFVP